MPANTTIKIYIADKDEHLHQQARALYNRIEVVSRHDLEKNPSLIAELEIAYGHLRPEQILQATKLRWLQTPGAGVDRFNTSAFSDRDIIFTTTSGMHAEPIAEHMFGMVLMVTRRLHIAREQQRSRQWRSPDGSVDILSGKSLGLLGVGAIGTHCACVGKAFGMRVIGLRRSSEPHPAIEQIFTCEERFAFLAQSDIVMNTLPLTEKTRHFLSEREFAAMKPGSMIVNAGRGATIDTQALIAALNAGRPKAALLDVTDPEPLPATHPLWTMENVYITAHFGGSHPSYNDRAGKIFIENLRRYLDGQHLINAVDKVEGY